MNKTRKMTVLECVFKRNFWHISFFFLMFFFFFDELADAEREPGQYRQGALLKYSIVLLAQGTVGE